MGRVHRLEGDGHEAEPVHGRADHRDFAGAGGRSEDGGLVPQARDQQRDVLQMEGQVRRPRRVGRGAFEVARRRERKAQGCLFKKMVTPAARREAVAQLRVAYEVSERRACSVLGADRTSVRYRSSRMDDAAARARLHELASVRRRFGYRRLHILLTREGIIMNHKKFRRLYREERLQVRRRSGRKRALGTRAPMALPQGPNQRWSLDFLSDAFANGRRFRILAIVDDFTRECLALVPDTSPPGLRVGRELDALITARGRPAMCVSDNGTELTGTAILRWSQETRGERDYNAPGKPQQNAFIESFNARLRD